MIQRIQTIFLLLAAAAGFSVLAFPFAETTNAVANSMLFADSQYAVNDNIGLLILFALAGALATASIFLFKNRSLQMKLGQFAIVADVIGLVLAVVLFWQDGILNTTTAIDDGISAYMPFAFILFGVLALRGIRKDEKLVSSMDRLR